MTKQKGVEQQQEIFKDEYDDLVLSLLPLSFLQGSRVADLEGPTEEEIATFFQHATTRCVVPLLRREEEKHRQQRKQPKPQIFANKVLFPDRSSQRHETATNLLVHISLRTPQKQPLIVMYDQLEMNTLETRQYRSSPARSNRKFRHVLLCDSSGGGRARSTSSSTATKATQERDTVREDALRSVDDWEEDQYHGIQWFPPEKNEFILNELESELAWLCEECLHALYRDTKTIDWDFIWNYASPSLKVEMRKLEFTDHQQCENDTDIHLRKLVRMGDSLVSRRFEVMRDWIKAALQSGYRRVLMKRAIAVLRLKPAEYSQEDDHHENRSNNEEELPRPKRFFPPPELHKARETQKRKKRKR